MTSTCFKRSAKVIALCVTSLVLCACGCAHSRPATVRLTLVDSVSNQPLREMRVQISHADSSGFSHGPTETDAKGSPGKFDFQHGADSVLALKPLGYHTSALMVHLGKLYIVAPLPDSIDIPVSDRHEFQNSLFAPSRYARVELLRDDQTLVLPMTAYPPSDPVAELERFSDRWGCPAADAVRGMSDSDFIRFQFLFRQGAREYHMLTSDEERVIELYQIVRVQPATRQWPAATTTQATD